MTWHPEVLPPAALELARTLARTAGIEAFYLAGGTGLALQRGHRVSVDLDFFSRENALGDEERAAFKARLSTLKGFRLRQESDGTLHVIIAGVEASFLRYPYALVRKPLRWERLAVASLQDIGLMKIGAIIGRGSRKDFRDLHEILRELSLESLLKLSRRKFPDAEDFLLQASKAMVYFDDARGAQDPRLLRVEPFDAVIRYFQREVPRVFERLEFG